MIEVAAGVYPVFALEVAGKSIVIRGTRSKTGELLTVLDGQMRPMIKVSNFGGPACVALHDLRLSRGYADPYLGYQGGITVAPGTELEASNCMFDSFSGGVVDCVAGSVLLNSCTLRENVAYRDVAGVTVAYGTLGAIDTIFQDNQSIYNDGAAPAGACVGVYAGVSFSGCRFVRNQGTYSGDLYVENSQLSAIACQFESSVGGSIRASGGTLNIVDSKLLNSTYGGGAVLAGVSGTLVRTEIAGNTAVGDWRGGGLSISRCELDITGCNVHGNSVSGQLYSSGGGIRIEPNDGTSQVRIADSRVCGNFSPYVRNIHGTWIDLGGNCLGGDCSSFDLDGNGEDDMCQKSRGDLNLDGIVSGGDLAVVLSNWSDYLQPFADGDLDGNSFVNAADLAILLSRWSGER